MSAARLLRNFLYGLFIALTVNLDANLHVGGFVRVLLNMQLNYNVIIRSYVKRAWL